MNIFLCALVAALPYTPGRFVSFQVESRWELFTESGLPSETLGSVGGLNAAGLALSSDGQTVVFSARVRSDDQERLFLRKGGWVTEIFVPLPPGYFSAPSFTRGQALLFSFHPDEPMVGSGASNAQIYELNLQRWRLRRVTTSQGCKGAPAEGPLGIYFNHATCTGYQSIGAVLQMHPTTVVGSSKTSLWAPVPSPVGNALAYLEHSGGRTRLRLRSGKQDRVLAEWDGSLSSVGLVWTANGRWLLFRDGPNIVGMEVPV
jgi:hypothetical protein